MQKSIDASRIGKYFEILKIIDQVLLKYKSLSEKPEADVLQSLVIYELIQTDINFNDMEWFYCLDAAIQEIYNGKTNIGYAAAMIHNSFVYALLCKELMSKDLEFKKAISNIQLKTTKDLNDFCSLLDPFCDDAAKFLVAYQTMQPLDRIMQSNKSVRENFTKSINSHIESICSDILPDCLRESLCNLQDKTQDLYDRGYLEASITAQALVFDIMKELITLLEDPTVSPGRIYQNCQKLANNAAPILNEHRDFIGMVVKFLGVIFDYLFGNGEPEKVAETKTHKTVNSVLTSMRTPFFFKNEAVQAEADREEISIRILP